MTTSASPVPGLTPAPVRLPQTLTGKRVVVFGGSGSVGSAVARYAALSGARVWLSGRTDTAVGSALAGIAAATDQTGAGVTGDVLDATDEAAVDAYIDRVAAAAGGIDGAFNAIGATPEELGYPAVSTSLDVATFLKPLHHILASTFLTSRSVARHMSKAGSGSIVTLSASISGSSVPWMAALTATCGGIEALTRALAFEFAPAGVRVNCVRGDAMPDTLTIPLTTVGMAAVAGVPVEAFAQSLTAPPLGMVSSHDTAATVAFLLSDAARMTSAQVVNVSSRTLVG